VAGAAPVQQARHRQPRTATQDSMARDRHLTRGAAVPPWLSARPPTPRATVTGTRGRAVLNALCGDIATELNQPTFKRA
jgi:hypothetical protein